MAPKNRTRIPISFGEKLKVGIRTFRYVRTPLRPVSDALNAGLARKRASQSGSVRAPSCISEGGNCSFQSGF